MRLEINLCPHVCILYFDTDSSHHVCILHVDTDSFHHACILYVDTDSCHHVCMLYVITDSSHHVCILYVDTDSSHHVCILYVDTDSSHHICILYSNPLESTVIKNETFELKNDCKSLKVKLMSPPIQTFPDFDKKFVLHTDTSAFSYVLITKIQK